MNKVQELVEKLREVRSILLSSSLGLTEAQLSTDLVTEKWSVKDILGHIASWQEEFTNAINRFLNEEKPEYDQLIREENNWSEWNLAQWQKKKSLSYKKTLEDFLSVQDKFVKLLENLKETDLSIKKVGSWGNESTVEQIILSQIDHELEHTRQILDWRKVKTI